MGMSEADRSSNCLPRTKTYASPRAHNCNTQSKEAVTLASIGGCPDGYLKIIL